MIIKMSVFSIVYEFDLLLSLLENSVLNLSIKNNFLILKPTAIHE